MFIECLTLRPDNLYMGFPVANLNDKKAQVPTILMQIAIDFSGSLATRAVNLHVPHMLYWTDFLA